VSQETLQSPAALGELAGELVTARSLACAICTDKHCSGTITEEEVGPAYTMAAVLQTFQSAMGAVAGVVALPVCLPCRKEQVGGPASGLLRA
jgi:hypothetical protein